MSVLGDLRIRVADALTAACAANQPEWTVHPLPVDAVQPPAFIVLWDDPWLPVRRTFCQYDAALSVRAISGRLEPDPGIEILEEMIELAVGALDADRLAPSYVNGPHPLMVASITYQAATLHLSNTINLTPDPGGP